MVQVGNRVCLIGENVCGKVEAVSQREGEEGVHFVDDNGNGWCVPSHYVTVEAKETIVPARGGTLRLGNGFRSDASTEGVFKSCSI